MLNSLQYTITKVNPSTAKPRPPDVGWYHSYDLGDWRIDGAQSLKYMEWRRDKFFNGPINVTGKTVLDLATWSGFFAFEAERCGASHVEAIDDVAWRYLGGREAFNYLHNHFKSKVVSEQVRIENLERWLGNRHFDVIIWPGLLYHVRNPISLIESVANHCDACIFDTCHDLMDIKVPAMQYLPKYEPSEMANYFLPNEPMVRHLLLDYGFKTVQSQTCPWHEKVLIYHATK